MEYEIVNIDGFAVQGETTVTTNAANEFGGFWGKFMTAYRGGEIVAVYHAYESDHRGRFAFTLGIVSEAGEVRIKGGKYAKFTVADRNDVAAVWQFVWQSELDRAYAADFEKYDECGGAEIYISLK